MRRSALARDPDCAVSQIHRCDSVAGKAERHPGRSYTMQSPQTRSAHKKGPTSRPKVPLMVDRVSAVRLWGQAQVRRDRLVAFGKTLTNLGFVFD